MQVVVLAFGDYTALRTLVKEYPTVGEPLGDGRDGRKTKGTLLTQHCIGFLWLSNKRLIVRKAIWLKGAKKLNYKEVVHLKNLWYPSRQCFKTMLERLQECKLKDEVSPIVML